MALIRVADVRDAAAIAHVHVQSWLATYRGIVPDDYLASLNGGERIPVWQDWLGRNISVLVAEVEGEVVGFASGGSIREPHQSYASELYTLYLLKKVQGRGIGKSLLSAVADALVQRHHKSMLVWVLAQNPAVRFYEKMGAEHLASKQIEIGSASLSELALGWPNLAAPKRWGL